jgi:hypothetical protein
MPVSRTGPDLDPEKLKQLTDVAKWREIMNIAKRLSNGESITARESKLLAAANDELKNGEQTRFFSGDEVAAHYELTSATVWRAVKDGKISQNPDGSFNKENTDAYWVGKLGREKKAIGWESRRDDGGARSEVAELIEKEKLRKIKAEADRVEIITAQLKNEVAPIEDVINAWCNRYRMVRDALLSLKNRMPPLLVGMDQGEIEGALTKEIHGILKGFAKNGRYIAQTDEPERGAGVRSSGGSDDS